MVVAGGEEISLTVCGTLPELLWLQQSVWVTQITSIVWWRECIVWKKKKHVVVLFGAERWLLLIWRACATSIDRRRSVLWLCSGPKEETRGPLILITSEVSSYPLFKQQYCRLMEGKCAGAFKRRGVGPSTLTLLRRLFRRWLCNMCVKESLSEAGPCCVWAVKMPRAIKVVQQRCNLYQDYQGLFFPLPPSITNHKWSKPNSVLFFFTLCNDCVGHSPNLA